MAVSLFCSCESALLLEYFSYPSVSYKYILKSSDQTTLIFVYYISTQNEYHGLVVKCMDFACELMDLCRGTQEVEAVLSEGTNSVEGSVDLLARLKMAIRYQEKKVGITLLHCICRMPL